MEQRIREIAAWYQSVIAQGNFGFAPGAYLEAGSTASMLIAVALPLIASVALLYQVRYRLREFSLLIGVWCVSLPLMYFTSFWREVDGVLSLQIIVIFSIAALILVWRQLPVAPGITYALTFLSLLPIDVIRAVQYALDGGYPLMEFLRGVGGAGVFDGLFVFPLLTALTVMYAHWRQAGCARVAPARDIDQHGLVGAK
ncbi:MAG: hypothetical protein ACKVQU_02660 [Burkholderiales bacterium]